MNTLKLTGLTTLVVLAASCGTGGDEENFTPTKISTPEQAVMGFSGQPSGFADVSTPGIDSAPFNASKTLNRVINGAFKGEARLESMRVRISSLVNHSLSKTDKVLNRLGQLENSYAAATETVSDTEFCDNYDAAKDTGYKQITITGNETSGTIKMKFVNCLESTTVTNGSAVLTGSTSANGDGTFTLKMGDGNTSADVKDDFSITDYADTTLAKVLSQDILSFKIKATYNMDSTKFTDSANGELVSDDESSLVSAKLVSVKSSGERIGDTTFEKYSGKISFSADDKGTEANPDQALSMHLIKSNQEFRDISENSFGEKIEAKATVSMIPESCMDGSYEINTIEELIATMDYYNMDVSYTAGKLKINGVTLEYLESGNLVVTLPNQDPVTYTPEDLANMENACFLQQ